MRAADDPIHGVAREVARDLRTLIGQRCDAEPEADASVTFHLGPVNVCAFPGVGSEDPWQIDMFDDDAKIVGHAVAKITTDESNSTVIALALLQACGEIRK
jgi:hypothetical protein